MKTISVINLKGGVGKTISSINIAYTLVHNHNKKVLLIDNDKQGNVSKFFGLHNYQEKGISDVLLGKATAIEAVQKTKYEKLDVITANMNLLTADKEILLDISRPQQTRLRKALKDVKGSYDYCVIDNAPDINMSVINALVASDDVLVPIKADNFAFDGMDQLIEQVESVQDFNEQLTLKGCFVTMFTKTLINKQGYEYLKRSEYPLFATKIRRTTKVDETTFVGKPLLDYGKSTAAEDYEELVAEYLKMNQ